MTFSYMPWYSSKVTSEQGNSSDLGPVRPTARATSNVNQAGRELVLQVLWITFGDLHFVRIDQIPDKS